MMSCLGVRSLHFIAFPFFFARYVDVLYAIFCHMRPQTSQYAMSSRQPSSFCLFLSRRYMACAYLFTRTCFAFQPAFAIQGLAQDIYEIMPRLFYVLPFSMLYTASEYAASVVVILPSAMRNALRYAPIRYDAIFMRLYFCSNANSHAH